MTIQLTRGSILAIILAGISAYIAYLLQDPNSAHLSMVAVAILSGVMFVFGLVHTELDSILKGKQLTQIGWIQFGLLVMNGILGAITAFGPVDLHVFTAAGQAATNTIQALLPTDGG